MNKVIMAILITLVGQLTFASTEGPSVTCAVEEWVKNKKVESYSITATQSSETNQYGETRYFDDVSARAQLKSNPNYFIAFKAEFEVIEKDNSMALRVDKNVFIHINLNGRMVGTFSLPSMNLLIKGCIFKDGLRK